MTSISRPESEAEIPVRRNPERAEIVESRHRRLAAFLDQQGFDAVLLQDPANFSWLTAGGDNSRGGSSLRTAALFVTHEARVIVTDNVNSPLLFDHELPGLGFQLKERPWHHPRKQLLADIARGRNVASDSPLDDLPHISEPFKPLRLPLAALDCRRMRELGRLVSHAVEATARRFPRGATEAEVAAEVAHRLIKRQVVPELIQVVSAQRAERYRHWSYDQRPIEDTCVISAVGRRYGLHAGASRSICFDKIPQDLEEAHHTAGLIHATGMHFSVAKWPLKDVWDRIARIYEKFGHVREWHLASQAEVVGYTSSESILAPESAFTLAPGMAVHWHPSVGAASLGDTVLLTERGIELITPTEIWPTFTVKVKKTSIDCPDILIRTDADLISEDSVFALKNDWSEFELNEDGD